MPQFWNMILLMMQVMLLAPNWAKLFLDFNKAFVVEIKKIFLKISKASYLTQFIFSIFLPFLFSPGTCFQNRQMTNEKYEKHRFALKWPNINCPCNCYYLLIKLLFSFFYIYKEKNTLLGHTHFENIQLQFRLSTSLS